MRRHLAYAALFLALTACSADDDPEPKVADPTPSASQTPSESAAPVKEAWEKRTPEGAISFTELWVAEFSTAFKTGDTRTLQRMSERTCQTCQSFISLISDVYSNGGRITGAAWELRSPAWSAANGKKGPVAVTGMMRIPEQTITRAESQPSTAKAVTARYVFQLRWISGRWSVSKLLRDS